MSVAQANVEILTAGAFIAKHPKPKPPVIEGVIRQREVGNLIGSTKQGKSWMMVGMALSIADGRDWLGHSVRQGPVLLVDNELEEGTLANRIRVTSEAMSIPQSVIDEQVYLLSLRTNQRSVCEIIEMVKSTEVPFLFVGLDCYYRFQFGQSELDITAVRKTYEDAIQLAHLLDAAVMFNHHSTKGSQSEKSVTDMGSGTGAISRAVDTHLVFREHTLSDCAVMEAACRSFRAPAPKTIKFEHPVWIEKNGIEPEIKTPSTLKRQKQEQANQYADDCVIAALEDGKTRTVGQITNSDAVDFGKDRVKNALNRLRKTGKVKTRTKNGISQYKKNEK